jgi:hypothetical protein
MTETLLVTPSLVEGESTRGPLSRSICAFEPSRLDNVVWCVVVMFGAQRARTAQTTATNKQQWLIFQAIPIA